MNRVEELEKIASLMSDILLDYPDDQIVRDAQLLILEDIRIRRAE